MDTIEPRYIKTKRPNFNQDRWSYFEFEGEKDDHNRNLWFLKRVMNTLIEPHEEQFWYKQNNIAFAEKILTWKAL